MDPERRRVQPQARALTDAGQSSRSFVRPMSRAIVGKDTTKMPASMLLMRVMQATVPMMTAALHFEIDGEFAFVRDSEEALPASGCSPSGFAWPAFTSWVGIGYLMGSNSMARNPSADTCKLVVVDDIVWECSS